MRHRFTRGSSDPSLSLPAGSIGGGRLALAQLQWERPQRVPQALPRMGGVSARARGDKARASPGPRRRASESYEPSHAIEGGGPARSRPGSRAESSPDAQAKPEKAPRWGRTSRFGAALRVPCSLDGSPLGRADTVLHKPGLHANVGGAADPAHPVWIRACSWSRTEDFSSCPTAWAPLALRNEPGRPSLYLRRAPGSLLPLLIESFWSRRSDEL